MLLILYFMIYDYSGLIVLVDQTAAHRQPRQPFMSSQHNTSRLTSRFKDDPQSRQLVGAQQMANWLVVWNMFYFSIYWE